jgi:hypothetical protein
MLLHIPYTCFFLDCVRRLMLLHIPYNRFLFDCVRKLMLLHIPYTCFLLDYVRRFGFLHIPYTCFFVDCVRRFGFLHIPYTGFFVDCVRSSILDHSRLLLRSCRGNLHPLHDQKSELAIHPQVMFFPSAFLTLSKLVDTLYQKGISFFRNNEFYLCQI